MSSALEERETESIDVNIEMPWGYVMGRWYGNRKVRPILALHGWLDNLGTWNRLLPLLPTHIGVLCIDLPGHGRSPRLPSGIMYHSWDFIRVVMRIMKAYNWQKISLLTHSMSSMYSFIFASIYPEKIDLFISIDVVQSDYLRPKVRLNFLRFRYEKFLTEVEREENAQLMMPPPTYSYEELQQLLYEGTQKSVELENCKHLLERNIAKSQMYPDKYYFSRDGRMKYYIDITTEPKLTLQLAQRLKNVPYCVIKGSESNYYIDERSTKVIELLRDINPHFEIHEVQGTHHVHLNNPVDVAAILSPFINRYRPPLLNAWTVDKDAADGDGRLNAQNVIKKQIKCQNWNWLKWKSKL